MALSSFAQTVRVNLGGGNLTSISKDSNERVVRLPFSVADELGDSHDRVLVAQLTGRSANLFLLNSEGIITQAWRTPQGDGQRIGERYRPPTIRAKAAARTSEKSSFESIPLPSEGSPGISEVADKHFSESQSSRNLTPWQQVSRANFAKSLAQEKATKQSCQGPQRARSAR